MIYFIVTTCLFNECPTRKNQYIQGITQLINIINNLTIELYRIIIVENNGLRDTFLDTLCDDKCCIFYTNNNFLQTSNKGYKELQDVKDCITHYGIEDSDFIVKMTGRYILQENREFMNSVKDIYTKNYDCIIRYGSYMNTSLNYRMDACITGLIGMKCFYIKQIEYPTEHECVEWKWANVTRWINIENINIVNSLGINICPGSNNYMCV